MDVHEKSNRLQIFQFKQIKKYANSQKLYETCKRNNEKSNKYNIKPGIIEKFYKNTKTKAEKKLGYNHKEKKVEIQTF